jgi:hypothetical protein
MQIHCIEENEQEIVSCEQTDDRLLHEGVGVLTGLLTLSALRRMIVSLREGLGVLMTS